MRALLGELGLKRRTCCLTANPALPGRGQAGQPVVTDRIAAFGPGAIGGNFPGDWVSVGLRGQEVAMVAATMYLDQLHPPAGETLESADLRRVDDVLDDTGDHSGRLARAALVTPSGPTSPRHGAPSSIRTASAAGGTAVTTAARDRAHWRQVAILGQRARSE